MAISSLFSISRSSLFAHQKALAVTSANLANANNPAYTRQIAMFGTLPPDHRASFSFGSGVAVEQVLRIRNSVTDTQIRNYNQQYFNADKQASVLKQVESLFSEPSEYGLSNLLTEFFNSWDELAIDPMSSPLRSSVVQSAEKLSDKISSIYKGITQTKIDVKNEANNTVKNINNLLEEINLANKQIYEASVVNSFANDLIDKRDAMLDELSQYVNINVSIDQNNVANVSIGGMFAVDGLHHVEFKLEQEGDRLKLANKDGSGSTSLQGGSLKGIFELFNTELPRQLKQLDDLAEALMENVNRIHSQGFSVTDPIQTGIDFFTGYKNGVLEINSDIINDHSYIAVSADSTNGNNEIALALAELKNQNLINGRTLSEEYSEFVSSVAYGVTLQEQKKETYELVLNQLNQQKAEYSGVSTDEEMMNIMKYQRSYDAAAKLITVADDLLQTILELV